MANEKSKHFYNYDRNMNLRYFDTKEFDCNCSECKEKGNTGMNMDKGFLQRLDNGRHESGIAWRINSGYRCPSHNKNVGGVKNSSHKNIPCKAADISTPDSSTRYKVITALLAQNFTRLGIGKALCMWMEMMILRSEMWCGITMENDENEWIFYLT